MGQRLRDKKAPSRLLRRTSPLIRCARSTSPLVRRARGSTSSLIRRAPGSTSPMVRRGSPVSRWRSPSPVENDMTVVCRISQQEYIDLVQQMYGRELSSRQKMRLVGYPHMYQARNPKFYCSQITQYIPVRCLAGGWHAESILGSGSFGTVLGLTTSDGQKGALKVAKARGGWISARREVAMQQAFARAGIGLPVLCWSIEIPQAFSALRPPHSMMSVRMDRVDTTVAQYLVSPQAQTSEARRNLVRHVFAIVFRLVHSKLTHGDMHPGNIGLLFSLDDPSKYRLVFLDFGRSSNRGSNLRLDLHQFLRGLRMLELGSRCSWFVDAINSFYAHVVGARGHGRIDGDDDTFKRIDDEYVRQYLRAME